MENLQLKERDIQFNDNQWFQYIHKGSNGLRNEMLLKNVLDQQNIEKLLKLTDISIRELCLRKSLDFGFRVWKSDEQKNVHFIRDNVFENPPIENETIEEWNKRVFEGFEMCFVTNQIERYSDEMAIAMSRIFKPVMEGVGIPMNGLHSTCFAGNYGFTPLGIHHDKKGSFVFNLHLGPGLKTMYTWEWNHFLSLGGKTNEKNIEKYLPKATKHVLYPGDVFFMPWDRFHVGYTEGFSVSLTNWFDFQSANVILNEIISYMRTFLKLEKDFYPESVNELNFKQKFRSVLDKFSFEGDRDILSLKENIIDAQELKMLKFFSNFGWKSIPLTLEETDGYNKLDFDHMRNSEIQNVYPFKIFVKHQGNGLYVFGRSHTFKYEYYPEIVKIIAKLNTFNRFLVSELIKYKPIKWSEDTFIYFLSTLYNVRAIEKV